MDSLEGIDHLGSEVRWDPETDRDALYAWTNFEGETYEAIIELEV